MRRRVTVDSTKSVRDSASESRRPSVFERLGPGAIREHRDNSARQDQCRNWLRDGSCPYGDTCHFEHGGSYSRGKDRLSDSEPPMDLRHRVESKRAERERHEREAWDDDRSQSPPIKEEKRRRSRHRDKDSSEKKKKKKKRELSSMVVKQDPSSSNSSEEGNIKDWPAQDDDEQSWDADNPDFEYVRELTLERRRQQLQRELERMEMEEDQVSDGGGREAIEDGNSTADEKQPQMAASSPPRKKHSKKKRSHSNSSKHDRQPSATVAAAPDEMEAASATSKSSKSHKKHKHLADTSPRDGDAVAEKSTDHHHKKKSRKSKSPVAASSRAQSPSPSPVKSKTDDSPPKKHKSKEGKKKEKAKKRKYQSDSSDDNKEEVKDKKRSSSSSRKKSGSKRHQSQSPDRSPSASPQRRSKQHRGPSPSSQSDSSARSSLPGSMAGSYASVSPKRSRKKKRYASPSPPPKRSSQQTPESATQARHSRRGSPEKSRHSSQSLNRGQSPLRKKRARSGSIGSSQRSQSPQREHRRSPSPMTRKQGSSRGRGSPGRDASGSRDKSGQRRPMDRVPPDARSKSGYDNKYDNKRQYSQERGRSSSNQPRDNRRDMQGRDMHGRDMQGRDLQGRDIHGRDMQGRDMQGREMPGRDMPGRDMPGREMPGRDMLGRDLPGRDMLGRDIQGRDMSGRDMSGGRDMPGRDMLGRDMSGGRDMPGRDVQGRDRGYPQGGGKDSGSGRSIPGRNERASRRDDWEKKRTRDGRDARDEPYNKRARSDTRGMSPSSVQKQRQYGREGGRDDDSHSMDRGRYGGPGGAHQRSASAIPQGHMLRQDRERSGSRRPDYPGDADRRGGGAGGGRVGRDNTPDFRRADPHLAVGGGNDRGRSGTPDSRRGDFRNDGKRGGRDNTPDARRQDYHQDGGRKGGREEVTPDNKKGRDGTTAEMRRPDHLIEGARKGRGNTPDDRRATDGRRGDKVKAESYGAGKYDDKRDAKKYDDGNGGKDAGRDRSRETSRAGDDQKDSARGRSSRSSSRDPAAKVKQEGLVDPTPQPPEPTPSVNVPAKTLEPAAAVVVKREQLKIKTESVESKVSSSASEQAKDSPAGLERKFSRFGEPFSDWSDEGSDGLLTRSSTPLEHEQRHGNRPQQSRPSRAAEPTPPVSGLPGPPNTAAALDAVVEKPTGLPHEMTVAEVDTMSEQILNSMKKELGDETVPASGTLASPMVDETAPPPPAAADVFQAGDAYEEISDDDEFLDDILEENKDEPQVPEKSVTEVDWNSLMKDIQPRPADTTASQEGAVPSNETKVSILEKFRPANVLTRVGVSRSLAGTALMKEIETLCQQGEAKSDDKGFTAQQSPLFEEQLGALNATAHRRYEQRKRLLTDIGPCRRALCARRDIMIRKQLRKDKDAEQVFNNPVIDTELYRLSLQLFRTKRPSLASPLESKDSGLVLKSISVSS